MTSFKRSLYAAALTAPFFLAACDATDSKEIPIAPNAGVSTLSSVSQMESHLMNGKTLTVSLDACKFSDDGWLSGDDPLGGLKCGEDYAVSYDSETTTWTTTGFNEGGSAKKGSRVIDTISRAGAAPAGGKLALWGAIFIVNDDMTVSYPSKGVVGSLSAQ